MIPYNLHSSNSHYSDYYNQQIGHGLTVFKGAKVQTGHGIGGFIKGLLKGALPLLKRGVFPSVRKL